MITAKVDPFDQAAPESNSVHETMRLIGSSGNQVELFKTFKLSKINTNGKILK